MSRLITRRGLLAGSAAASGMLLSGCDRLADAPSFRWLLDMGQSASQHVQRLLLSAQPLVREYSEADISPDFPPNGTEMPRDMGYFQAMASQFIGFRLKVEGLVRNPLSLSLTELRALPARTQITMHSCDEGWSAIGKWTGVPLGHLLGMAELAADARYIVFHCLDELERAPNRLGFYYESIDLFDAFHPQTILAYEMNDRDLPVRHGAPLRLRVERQIGYKNAKFVNRIEAVAGLDKIGRGKGGFWEDRGYQWYAGL
jgi:DMSO/TMAO reductase YedYZ molybdopterin-dependent catalytic subunit